MRFFKHQFNPKDITADAPDNDKLNEFLKEKGINMEVVDISTQWAAFGLYHATQNGLDIITSSSFGYILSLFYADMGVSAGTDAYFYEGSIEQAAIDFLNENLFADEVDKAQQLFMYIFNIYSTLSIMDYEKKAVRLDFRLGLRSKELFMGVHGESKNEKILNLLRAYYEH